MELAGVKIFQGLSQAALADIQSAAKKRAFARDSFLFMQDDPAECLYLLISGRVKLLQLSPDGQQVILRVANAGQEFGVVALLGKATDTYPVSAQAVEDCTVLAWTAESLAVLQQKYPQLAMNGTRHLVEKMKETYELYRQLATERVEMRIARLLLRLAAQVGKKTGQGVLIDFPLSRQDLAEMSGASLFTVSRTLSQWERLGLVQAGRERVVITNPHGLVTLAES